VRSILRKNVNTREHNRPNETIRAVSCQMRVYNRICSSALRPPILERMGTELVIGGATVVAFGMLLMKYAAKIPRTRDFGPVSQQWLNEQRVREES